MSKNDPFGDERLTKSSGVAARGSRDNADVSRVQEDGMTLSAAERRKLLRQDWVQEVLPTPPAIPGFHMCWVSTTNSVDPVYKRLQLGYQPVKASEVPGMEQYRVTDDAQFEGCVRCQEMLLFKIPEQVYQDIMAIYHHDIPLEQEQSIYERVAGTQEKDSTGRSLVTVEGDFNKLGGRASRTPTFA
jgi:hypothetical protein